MLGLSRAAVAVAALVCVAMSPLSADPADKAFVVIGTGGPTGVYFAAGNSICRMMHRSLASGRGNGPRCAAPASDGSIFNLGQIRDGGQDFAMVQSDWQFHAYHGSDRFEGDPMTHLRTVFSLHHEPFHIVVAKQSNIRRWNDLRGKRVNIGNPGSGHRGTMEVLMAAYGTTADDFEAATELAPIDQTKALCDGTIDAYAYTVGVPSSGVAVAAAGCGARVIGPGGGDVQKLVEDNPFYRSEIIPQGAYATLASDVATFAVTATLVTHADQPDDVVYELVRAVFENLEDFRNLHAAFAGLEPSEMIGTGLWAPLHPGAVKYYRERGWM